jgi:hypothetical protein
MQAPEALHAPDWQRYAVAVVQPVSPVETPQVPCEQVLNSHSAPEPQAWPTAEAQVLVVTLHRPVAQVGATVVAAHTPVCSPSTGMGAPLGRRATQVNALRLQKALDGQSESAQQLPGAAGTQVPLGAQALVVHCAAAVQLVPGAVPQVSVVSLQRPPWQVALTPPSQVPSCRPSLGIGVPAVSVGAQVLSARSQ